MAGSGLNSPNNQSPSNSALATPSNLGAAAARPKGNIRVSSGPRTDFVSTLGRYTAHTPTTTTSENPASRARAAAAANKQMQNNATLNNAIATADKAYSLGDMALTARSVGSLAKGTAGRWSAFGGLAEVAMPLYDIGSVATGYQTKDDWWRKVQTSGMNNGQAATGPMSYLSAAADANSNGLFRNLIAGASSNIETGGHLMDNVRRTNRYATGTSRAMSPIDTGRTWRSTPTSRQELDILRNRLGVQGPSSSVDPAQYQQRRVNVPANPNPWGPQDQVIYPNTQ